MQTAERKAFEAEFKTGWEDPAMARERVVWSAAWRAARAHMAITVTDEDIEAAREHIADVHNAEQLRSALSQLRPEVVAKLESLGVVQP